MREYFPRVFGLSTFDLGATVIIAFYSSKYFEGSYTKHLFSWLALGEIIHLGLGIETPITNSIN